MDVNKESLKDFLKTVSDVFADDPEYEIFLRTIQKTHAEVNYDISVNVISYWDDLATTDFERQFRQKFIEIQAAYNDALIESLRTHLAKRDMQVIVHLESALGNEDASTTTH